MPSGTVLSAGGRLLCSAHGVVEPVEGCGPEHDGCHALAVPLHAQKICEAEHSAAHQVFDRKVN